MKTTSFAAFYWISFKKKSILLISSFFLQASLLNQIQKKIVFFWPSLHFSFLQSFPQNLMNPIFQTHNLYCFSWIVSFLVFNPSLVKMILFSSFVSLLAFLKTLFFPKITLVALGSSSLTLYLLIGQVFPQKMILAF